MLGVSNSNCSEGQMRTYTVTQSKGRIMTLTQQWRYLTLLEISFTSYFLRKVSWVISKSFCCLYICLKGTCSLT